MRNELFVLEKTDHPHITQVFELLEDKKHFYVVMELLSGGNLLQKISKMKVFGESHAAKIIY
jgi:serine/threonine protein kinase